MPEAPSVKEALEDLQHFSDTQLECNPKMQKVVATVISALATLQPEGERREAIARLVGKHLGPYLAISPTARYEAIVREFIRELLASGLVQNEAGWRDISTAPKDGTEIIGCFCCDYGYQEKPTVYGPWTIAWDGKEWRSSWDDSEVIDSQCDFGTDYKSPDCEPTHWMPLPTPPIRSARDGGAS